MDHIILIQHVSIILSRKKCSISFAENFNGTDIALFFLYFSPFEVYLEDF